jgi:hypothetical protein
MNVAITVSVGSINVTLDATDVVPDTMDEMTTKAAVLIRTLCTNEDLAAAAREPVALVDPDE